jgi:hypothetical protein
VSLHLPDAEHGYYRGTRFDWSGLIEAVEYAGHRFYGPLHEEHDPHVHDCVGGPAEEFAMFHPMGFDEAAPGESFVKVGVGLLERSTPDAYCFDGNYRMVRPGDWTVDREPTAATFTHTLEGERGWAYRYRKTVRLEDGEPAFTIHHVLENLGDKTIDIDHYSHNFTIIDDVPYGPDYTVEVPFATDAPVALGHHAWFLDDRIHVEKPLEDGVLWGPLFEGTDPGTHNAAIVRNRKTGASVSFRGDAPITRMVFWAVERAACPEPFIHIYLEPGQTKEWSTTYRFAVDG